MPGPVGYVDSDDREVVAGPLREDVVARPPVPSKIGEDAVVVHDELVPPVVVHVGEVCARRGGVLAVRPVRRLGIHVRVLDMSGVEELPAADGPPEAVVPARLVEVHHQRVPSALRDVVVRGGHERVVRVVPDRSVVLAVSSAARIADAATVPARRVGMYPA